MPLNRTSHHTEDVHEDGANTRNPELQAHIIALAHQARTQFGHHTAVTEACNEVDLLMADEQMSMRAFCRMIRRMERRDLKGMEIPNDEKRLIGAFLEEARGVMAQALDEFRDPTRPLMPSEIVRLNPVDARFKGKPWYMASVPYLDPHAGTTGGLHMPHLLLMRTHDFVDSPETRFGPDYFHRTNYFKQQIALGKQLKARGHSACFVSEVLNHDRCDCSIQLRHAMDMVEENGLGVVAYLQQEARGAGLLEKLRFYGLVDGRDRQGNWIGKDKYDTKTSMQVLGHEAEQRKYWFLPRMLRGIGIDNAVPLTLITNNPLKTQPFVDAGYTVAMESGAQRSVRSNEAVSEIILLKIIDQKHRVPWSQLCDQLEPQLAALERGEAIDMRVYTALCHLLHHMNHNGVHGNLAPELAAWIARVQGKLQPIPDAGEEK